MKRFLATLLALAMVFVFVSCEEKPEPPKEYTLTFNTNGKGEAPAVQKIVEGQKATRPEDPAAVGYTFGGWFKEEACTNLWDFAADTVSSDVTLYAKWTEKSFTVTFSENGNGTAPVAAVVQEGQKVAEPEALTAVGYTFGGWFRDAECTTDFDFDADAITSDITLYAKWTLNTYTFSFVMNDHGSAVESETVSHGSKATKPADPTDDNYAFWAWYTDEGYTTKYDFNTAVIADTTVYAKWTEKKTITYVTEYGTLAVNSDRVGLGLRITEPTAPSYSGYAFDGWYTADDKLWNFTQHTVQGDMTLTAKWTLICSAVFNLNGHGEAIDSQDDLEAGKKVGKPEDPTAAGYVFGGWYTDAACEGKKWNFVVDTITTNPLNLYAKWTPVEVAVILLKNSGTSDGAAMATYGEDELDVATAPEKTSATLEGYYIDSSFTKKVANADGTLIANVSGYTNPSGKWTRLTDTNLYARWSYTLTFTDPHGYYDTVPAAVTVKEGNKVTKPADPSTAAESGYSYVWMPADGNDAFDFTIAPSSSATLSIEKSYNGNDYTVKANDQRYTATKYAGTGGAVTVPAIINGKRIYAVESLLWNATNGNNVTSITFSEGIQCLGVSAISGGRALTRVVIPSTVSSMPTHFFYCCSLVTDVEISPENRYFKLEDGAIYSYDKTTLIAVLPNTATYTFPDTVRTITAGASCYNTELSSVVIPDTVTSIGNAVFQNSNVSSVTLPSNMTAIPSQLLAGCKNITSLVIPEGVTKIMFDSLSYCGFTTIDIPSGVTEIGKYAFSSSSLTSFEFPSGVTTLSTSVLSSCKNLTSVTIPNGVTTIKDYAFYGCSKLPSITIPESVTTIEGYAFQDCFVLKEITLEYAGGVIPYTTDLLTRTHADLVIRVPASLVDSYKAAEGWSDFASKIEAIPL